MAARTVAFQIGHAMPVFTIVIGRDGSQLQGTEGAAVDIRFHLHYPLHKPRVRGQHAHAPAWHIVALRHGVELNTAFLGAGYLQQADRSFIQDKTVGIVVHDNDTHASGKIHQPLIGLHLCVGSCRHVGVVGPHQFNTAHVHAFQFFKVRLPTVFRLQVVVNHLATQQPRQRRVGGIAGIRHEHLVAGITQRQRHVQYALL